MSSNGPGACSTPEHAQEEPPDDHPHRDRAAGAAGTGRRPSRRLGRSLFAAIVVGVLAVGAYLAFGDFLNRGSGATAGAIDVQSSMAGFTPSEIQVKAGITVTLDWWTAGRRRPPPGRRPHDGRP